MPFHKDLVSASQLPWPKGLLAMPPFLTPAAPSIPLTLLHWSKRFKICIKKKKCSYTALVKICIFSTGLSQCKAVLELKKWILSSSSHHLAHLMLALTCTAAWSANYTWEMNWPKRSGFHFGRFKTSSRWYSWSSSPQVTWALALVWVQRQGALSGNTYHSQTWFKPTATPISHLVC